MSASVFIGCVSLSAKKDIMITAGGKNIAPQLIKRRVMEQRYGDIIEAMYREE